jgi:hypothetical protein
LLATEAQLGTIAELKRRRRSGVKTSTGISNSRGSSDWIARYL